MLTLVELAKSDLLAPWVVRSLRFPHPPLLLGRPIATIPSPPFATGLSPTYCMHTYYKTEVFWQLELVLEGL